MLYSQFVHMSNTSGCWVGFFKAENCQYLVSPTTDGFCGFEPRDPTENLKIHEL